MASLAFVGHELAFDVVLPGQLPHSALEFRTLHYFIFGHLCPKVKETFSAILVKWRPSIWTKPPSLPRSRPPRRQSATKRGATASFAQRRTRLWPPSTRRSRTGPTRFHIFSSPFPVLVLSRPFQ